MEVKKLRVFLFFFGLFFLVGGHIHQVFLEFSGEFLEMSAGPGAVLLSKR